MKLKYTVIVGEWIAHVFLRETYQHGQLVDTRYVVRLDWPDGCRTDWPIMYDNGKIAYDDYFPSVTPEAREATEKAFKWIQEHSKPK